MDVARICTWSGSIAVLCAAAATAALPGCGSESCEQDYPPPSEISTSQSTYTLDYLSSSLGIASVRWENRTTGEAGTATLSVEYRCVPFIGCGTWKVIAMDIPLAAGSNTVYVFEYSDGCEWRDDYLITMT